MLNKFLNISCIQRLVRNEVRILQTFKNKEQLVLYAACVLGSQHLASFLWNFLLIKKELKKTKTKTALSGSCVLASTCLHNLLMNCSPYHLVWTAITIPKFFELYLSWWLWLASYLSKDKIVHLFLCFLFSVLKYVSTLCKCIRIFTS